jgi:hypothetical protein
MNAVPNEPVAPVMRRVLPSRSITISRVRAGV